MRGHLESVEQLAIIQAVTAGADHEGAAQRINPDLAGMRGQQHRIIGITHRPGQHRLFGGADLVQRRANFAHRNLPAAHELGQIEHHRLDPVIRGSALQRLHNVARAILCGRHVAGEQRLQRIAQRRFFDDGPVKLQQQRSVLHRAGAGPGGHDCEQPHEKQQQKQQREPVLHRDQQFPDLASEYHARSLL